MTRFAPPLIALLLCGTALAGCATDIMDGSQAKKAAAATTNNGMVLPTDIEGGVRQAQLQRTAGKYDDAIHTLSQLMLVASDDPRVIGEYGKTLAEKGRAQDAIQFLTRATQLQPSDWTLYSAMGVAYDQLGDQNNARSAYERALKLKPGEASVLNNYALSRMLANDPAEARQLIARAQIAGGSSDPKIARNIALVNATAPVAPAMALVQKPAPAQMAASAPLGAPTPINSHALPVIAPVANNQATNNQPAKQAPAPQVVMQKVPVDPLAGPVKTASHAPTPLIAHAAPLKKADAPKVAAAEKAKAADAVKSDAKPVKAADAKPVADIKPTARPDAKPADTKPDAKAVKAADAKPAVKEDTKPAAKPGIPALRQTASAY